MDVYVLLSAPKLDLEPPRTLVHLCRVLESDVDCDRMKTHKGKRPEGNMLCHFSQHLLHHQHEVLHATLMTRESARNTEKVTTISASLAHTWDCAPTHMASEHSTRTS